MKRDAIKERRDAILAAAGESMAGAHRRRARNARITGIAAMLAIAVLATILVARTTQRPAATERLAIDFRSVDAATRSVDFAIVRETGVPLLDTLTDAEAEQALVESGYCVKIFRVRDQPMLVDCATGAQAVIR